MKVAPSSRARNKIRQWFSRETREETEQKGRESLEQALKAQNLPYRKLAGSALLAQVIRETGFKKAEDFYLALGSGKLPPSQIVNKVLQRLKTTEVAEEEPSPRRRRRARRSRATTSASGAGRRGRSRPARQVLHARPRRPDRRLHLARQGDHDPPRGLPQREGAAAQPGALHRGRLGRRRVARASASRSPSTPGIGRACSRTSRGRSPSTARTSSPTAASSRISWRRTGTRPRSATSRTCAGC